MLPEELIPKRANTCSTVEVHQGEGEVHGPGKNAGTNHNKRGLLNY